MKYCMTKKCVKEYLDKLEENIAEYMNGPVSGRSTEAVEAMVECWERVKTMYNMIWPDGEDHEADEELSEEKAAAWNSIMKNADGTVGGHWLIADTNAAGKPDDITPRDWNVAMNMVYSDYCIVAANHGVDNAKFYADMAKAFLHDTDAEPNKLAKYYHYIIRKY